MKVSVVTCTWNSVATLNDTIESVQRQRGVDIEHIFVDGGSTDGTLHLIERRCPGALVIHGVAGGVAPAMNAGATAASGDLLAYLHADDYYYSPGAVASAVAAFAGCPDLRWAYGRIGVLAGSRLALPTSGPMPMFTLRRYLRGAVSVPHPAVFMRTSTFRALGGFNPQLRYAMDIDLWLRIAVLHAPARIDQILTIFREHPGSLSTANKLDARAEEWRVRRRLAYKYPVETAIYALRYWRRTSKLRGINKARV